MANIKDIATGRSDVFKVPPDQVHEMAGFNVRDYSSPARQEYFQALKASLMEVGQKHPITARMVDGVLYVTSGHTRVKAIKELIAEGVDFPAISVLMENKITNEIDREAALILDNSGDPLTPYEVSSILKRLSDRGLEASVIAKKVNLSLSTVCSFLNVQAAPQVLQDMVKGGELSMTEAVLVVRDVPETSIPTVLAVAKADAKAEAEVKGKPAGKAKVTAKNIKAAKEAVKAPSKTAAKAKPAKLTERESEIIDCALSLLDILDPILQTLTDKQKSTFNIAVAFIEKTTGKLHYAK